MGFSCAFSCFCLDEKYKVLFFIREKKLMYDIKGKSIVCAEDELMNQAIIKVI
jgi:hypothetical protein